MKKINVLLIAFCLSANALFAFQNPSVSSGVSTGNSEKISRLNQSAADFIGKNQFTEAQNAAHDALEESMLKSDDAGRSAALDNLGLVAQARFDYTNAMQFFVESQKIREAASDKRGIAVSKNHVGKLFLLQKNETQAVTNFQVALGLLHTNKEDLTIAAATHRNLGDAYLAQKFYGKAVQEFEMALKIWAEDLQDLTQAASVAAYLGKVNLRIGDNDAAMNNFTASQNLHRQIGDETGLARDFLNLAELHNTLNDNQLAVENALQAQSAFEHIKTPIGVAETNCLLGKIALKNNDRVAAESYFDQSGAILRGLPFQPEMPEIYRKIALGFAEMGNFMRGYDYYANYATAKDSLFNNEKSHALLELTTRFESELSVKDKNRQLATLEKQKATEQKLRWLLVGLVGFALAALYATYRNYKLKKEDNEKLVRLNQQVRAQNLQISKQNDDLENKNVELGSKNVELAETNTRLDLLNARLVEEISEREQSQRSLFSKDHFLANVTGRMREPLSMVVALSQSLMNEKPRRDQRDQIQELQFAANSLLVLINDVLDFSKIEVGKLSFSSVDFDVNEIVENIYKNLKSNKATDSVELTIDHRLPAQLNGDPVRLEQIMGYLLKNIQAQIPKTASIKLEFWRHELISNDLQMRVDFVVEGKLKDFDHLKALLTSPIADDSNNDLNRTDMELMVMRRLVELQNGTVELVENAADVTILSIVLPFRLTEMPKVAVGTEGSQKIEKIDFLAGKSILVVEDNKVNQMLVANMLRKRGATVAVANDGIEGLDALAATDFDLILMDIQMPRMDGYRAVAEIRRLKNATKATVPIIALTASAYINEKEKAQLFGMTDHIGKPFSPEELLEKVARVMSNFIQPSDTEVMPAAAARG